MTGTERPSDRFIRLADARPIVAAKPKPKPRRPVALDRVDRGIKAPSYLAMMRAMENWDEIEFPDVP